MEHAFHNLTGSEEEKVEIDLWDKFKDDPAPNTFGHLKLAEDGGMPEVEELYSHGRWVTSIMLILFVLYNIFALVMLDVSFIAAGNGNNTQAVKNLEDSMGINQSDFINIRDSFYMSNTILGWVSEKIGMEKPSSIMCLGLLEVTILASHLAAAVFAGFQIWLCPGFKRWFAVQQISFDVLPYLSTYSGMKLCYNIVPSILSTTFFELLACLMEAKAEKKSLVKPILSFLGWIVLLVVSFFVGFDTFLFKLRVVSARAIGTEINLMGDVLPCVQFLVQVLGVVQLGPFVRKRLFVFIFGGEDGILQDEEIRLMEVWNALLVKRMYEDFAVKMKSKAKFFAVLTSFCDEDFQKLVLNENAEAKKAALGE